MAGALAFGLRLTEVGELLHSKMSPTISLVEELDEQANRLLDLMFAEAEAFQSIILKVMTRPFEVCVIGEDQVPGLSFHSFLQPGITIRSQLHMSINYNGRSNENHPGPRKMTAMAMARRRI